ncbi:hypothetical protein BBJ29_004169 [Phytophthora kernoviae]|uniref:Uncharacterized protein n=1 Tax=Phytophthora kernoviae TaxID=325452 RepID=A0A3F2S4E9_9STRA|nr:hypothetical protein BBJ29_004169 [Phytophthora kernoviae]RLN69255.1 hypothetical protein BBP00_00000518 [Phytophthora kernoviae]
MGRKRKKDDCAKEWDVVDETQDFDAIPPLFELVVETQDSVAIPLPFETVSETQNSDAETHPHMQTSKQVCIAYGDWSRRTDIKGHASGPVKGFVEALKRRAIVIPMDEYRTSITCSCCHQRLKQTRLFTKIKRKEDEEGIRQKEWLPMKEVKEVVEMARFRNPKLTDKKVVLKCTRNVLRCTNSGCKANFWNRDVNAVRIMLELLKSGLKGKHGARRLRAFRRGQ